MNDNVEVGLGRSARRGYHLGDVAIVPSRRTRDIDLALATPQSDEEFERLGYRIFREGGKKVIRTKEGVKLDVYTRDVSGIRVPVVFETAVTKRVGSGEVKVMCLEALLIAKTRASRPQDIEDVQTLCRRLGRTIRWDVVDTLATQLESAELKNAVSAFSR